MIYGQPHFLYNHITTLNTIILIFLISFNYKFILYCIFIYKSILELYTTLVVVSSNTIIFLAQKSESWFSWTTQLLTSHTNMKLCTT